MDFSALLAGEIEKKKKEAQKKDTSAVNEKTDDNDGHAASKISASSDRNELILQSGQKRGIDESTSSETIPDDVLDAKLLEFGELVLQDTREQKIEKLHLLLRNEKKQQKYTEVVQRELELQRHPERKTILLEWISKIEEHKEDMFALLRVLIKDIVGEWEIHISSISDAGDAEIQQELLFETKRDLVKLLYKLRSRKLNIDMLTSLSTILYYIQRLDFHKANESYLKLSIGNVAWPIGVQGVGIHARSADLKITGLSKSSNIMIDDTTRRWMTAVKRLVTFKELTRG